MFTCEFCDKTVKTKKSLKRHKESNKLCLATQALTVPIENIVSRLETCPKCEKQFVPRYMNQHDAVCPGIKAFTGILSTREEVVPVETSAVKESLACHICKKISTSKCGLRNHLWTMHDIHAGNRSIYKCIECEYETKNKHTLQVHLFYTHKIVNTKFRCEHCFLDNPDENTLTRHLFRTHDIGTGKIYKCTHCTYTTKWAPRIKQHLFEVHNIGNLATHTCPHCSYTAKRKWCLNMHVSKVHDIGDKQCSICLSNVHHIVDNTCRKCYNKFTGHSSRPEKEMVEFIRKSSLAPYIVLENQILKGESCDTKRRPDLILASPRLVIVVECDEAQHKYYSPDCESGRIDEILDELPLDSRVCIIRWNPDSYKPPAGTEKLNRVVRLEKLVKVLLAEVSKPRKVDDEEHIKFVYMFYDAENPVIVDRWGKELVY